MKYLQVNKGAIQNRLEGLLNELNFIYKVIENHFIFCREQRINPIETPHSRQFITINHIVAKGKLSKGPNAEVFATQVKMIKDFIDATKSYYSNHSLDKLALRTHLAVQNNLLKNLMDKYKGLKSARVFDEGKEEFQAYIKSVQEHLCLSMKLNYSDIQKSQYPIESILSLSFNKIKVQASNVTKGEMIYLWIIIYLHYIGWFKQNGYTNTSV